MVAHRALPLLLIASLLGCDDRSKTVECGESFCLPGSARLMSRETPVEDFNLYHVEADGQEFVLYEGDYPQESEGSIVIPWGAKWPKYLEVSGRCASTTNCVKQFAAQITHRGTVANVR